MTHHEVEDVRNRLRVRRPEVRLSITFDRYVSTKLVLENNGDSPVFQLKLNIPEATRLALKLQAPALLEGISALNPGERLAFHIGTVQELFQHDALKVDTMIELLYEHEDGSAGRQFIIFNLSNHDHSSLLRTDVDFLRDDLNKKMDEVVKKLERIGGVLERTLGMIASPTGLSISADTLTRLPGSGENPKKWNAATLNWEGFQKVLGCNQEMARKLSQHFYYRQWRSQKLTEVEGMTPELLKTLQERMELPGEDLDSA